MANEPGPLVLVPGFMGSQLVRGRHRQLIWVEDPLRVVCPVREFLDDPSPRPGRRRPRTWCSHGLRSFGQDDRVEALSGRRRGAKAGRVPATARSHTASHLGAGHSESRTACAATPVRQLDTEGKNVKEGTANVDTA